MTCEAIQQLIPEVALGNASRDHEELVATHLAEGCSECRRHLAESRRTWSRLAAEVHPDDVAPLQRTRMLKRILSDKPPLEVDDRFTTQRDPPVTISIAERVDRRRRVIRAAAVAATAAVGICGLTWLAVDQFGRIRTAHEERIDFQGLQRQLASKGNFQSPRIRFASVHYVTQPTGERGQLIIDLNSRQCHLFAIDWEPLPEDQVYQLWTVVTPENHVAGQNALDSAEWIPQSTLEVNNDGVGSALCDLPEKTGVKMLVVVTVRSRSQQPQPGGERVLESSPLELD